MKYNGSCHCGKVKYEVEMTVDSALECNCSICTKKGGLLGFTSAENFKLLSGENELSDYQWNHKVIHHLFCKNCGVQSFSRATDPKGNKMVAINLKCLDNLDYSKLPVHKHDGRSIP